ncbi:MAG TPA: O-antigen ligase family protein [Pyrinomonadaceae bacterium]|nr:O-antigen ligase family protein [Pyrinomonadaceae bacterium]
MPRGRSQTDYDVRRTTTSVRRARLFESEDAGEAEVWPQRRAGGDGDGADGAVPTPAAAAAPKKAAPSFLRRGHGLTYIALFLFTVILYARPAEFYPSPWTASIAFIAGVVVLCFFLPTQLALEGNVTARPREVNLVLLFCLTGALSVPLAISPGEAWATFSDTFIRCVFIFVVMVNVVRTEARLRGLLFLALAVSIWLSFGAINDYRLGLMTVEGYRVGGRGSGIFGNSNDMALHLVTVLPVTVALLLGSRRLLGKIFYGACAALLISAIVLTYSRGAFIGLLVVFAFMAFKLGRGHRLGVLLLCFLVVAGLLLFAPGNYGRRVLSIFVPSLDPVGSSDSRRGELIRSIQVAVRHPLLGIGMGNYATQMSYRGLVTHNSYTQVAAEMGAAALVLYTMFVVAPLRRLGQIARETFAARRESRYYYLAVGLQASLLAYMVTSFFASVAYLWYVYYLVAYAVCLRRLYESETGREVVPERQKAKEEKRGRRVAARLAGSEG